MRSSEDAVSEVAAEILIISLVLVLAAFIFALVFGVMPQIPKTAYLATDISVKQMPNYSAVAISHKGGDELGFTDAAEAPYLATLFVDSATGTYPVTPLTGDQVFGPGDTVYIYYNGTGYNLVSNLDGVIASPAPFEDMRVRIVDATANLLIQGWGTVQSGAATPVTATPTTILTVNVTATIVPNATATIVPNVTATIVPNATATVMPNVTSVPTTTASPVITRAPVTTTVAATSGISVSWSPNGLGYVSLSPPNEIANPGTVTVPVGSSQKFYFVPMWKKAVRTIIFDGATVYTGAAENTTVTYTINKVGSSHTLVATFG
ncbi:MAG: type IV pilin N-terminal domain-containing protein [Methanoregula sp.]|jgi:hypothetical protein|nr:type IV pilin N-terminal domain-containing protein [Methanoregula sp.]MDD5188639.1 type IV pilin N-terminal domain-containing protein [Methanoregula sp.]